VYVSYAFSGIKMGSVHAISPTMPPNCPTYQGNSAPTRPRLFDISSGTHDCVTVSATANIRNSVARDPPIREALRQPLQ
jgi:hypothetical protein